LVIIFDPRGEDEAAVFAVKVELVCVDQSYEFQEYGREGPCLCVGGIGEVGETERKKRKEIENERKEERREQKKNVIIPLHKGGSFQREDRQKD
jgi:hypothetical protein